MERVPFWNFRSSHSKKKLDFVFNSSIIENALKVAKTWIDWFCWLIIAGIAGAAHSDELLSLFSTNVSDQLTVEDRKLSEQIITYWVNFMYSGWTTYISLAKLHLKIFQFFESMFNDTMFFNFCRNPNQPEKRNIEWKRTNKNFDYLHISASGFKIKSEPLGQRYSFWSSLVTNLQNN